MFRLNRKKQFFVTITAFIASIFILSGIQGQIINVSAEVVPITVSVDDLNFGTAFPGESLAGGFVVSIADGQEGDVLYRIVQKRKPLPENHPEFPDGGDPELPGYYKNLCPYLTKVSNEGEGDIEGGAIVSAEDTSDQWTVFFEVPAVIGEVAQDHTGGIIDGDGEYGCDVSIEVFLGNTSICGYKFNDENENGVQDENEEGLLNWTILLQQFDQNAQDFGTIETTSTDEDGYYCFQEPVIWGEYRVREEQQDGWTATTPEFEDVEIDDGSNLVVNFGNVETVTAQTEPPSNGGGGGGGGGGVGGGPTGLIIFLEDNLEPSTTEVTVTWYTNVPATTRVVYDTVSHTTLGEAPNYGYAFSTEVDNTKVTFHSVILTGLTPGTEYFWRAISSASPEKLGKEIIVITDQEEGIIAGVEYAETDETKLAGGSILGVDYSDLGKGYNATEPTITVQEPEPEEVMEEVKGDSVIDEQEEGDVSIIEEPDLEDEDIQEEATSTQGFLTDGSCVGILWVLLIIDIIIGLAIIRVERKDQRLPIKDAWLYYLLLVLIPVIVQYPACGLNWWLLVIGIIGVLYLAWRYFANRNQQPPSSISQQGPKEEIIIPPSIPSEPMRTPTQTPPSVTPPQTPPQPSEPKRPSPQDDIDRLFPPIE